MTEFDTIADAAVRYLKSRLDTAVCAYPIERMERHDAPVTAVGIEKGAARQCGFGEYLGIAVSQEHGQRELYGKRLEAVLILYVYSPKLPKYGAAGCHTVFGSIVKAMEERDFPLKVSEITCGETAFDRDTDMFLCKCRVKCSGLLTAELTETGGFTDFKLQGVII